MGILYVSDLDGTLLNTSASLSPYTIKTINGLVEKGMLFTYATARSLSSASVAAKGLNPKIPVIVYNGAYIMEPATGNILASESFTKEERSYVERKLSGYGVSPVVYSFIKGRECVSWNLLQINEGKRDILATDKEIKDFALLRMKKSFMKVRPFIIPVLGKKKS